MIVCNSYERRVGILGAGVTGIAAAHALIASEAFVYIYDENEEKINSLEKMPYLHQFYYSNFSFIASYSLLLLYDAISRGRLHFFRENYEDFLENIELLIVSPGFSIHSDFCHPIVKMAIDRKIRIVSDIELLQETCGEARYIGITGTNGKSTTTALLAHIFRAARLIFQMGGNIGNAPLSLEPLDRLGTYILELSSFQLEMLTAFDLNIAILLNIAPDHLDRYKSIEEYAGVKSNIFNRAQNILISVDDDYCTHIYDTLINQQICYPISTKRILKNGISVVDNILFDNISKPPQKFVLKLENLLGQHNMQNIAAAYGAAILSNINPERVINSLSSFKTLRHRLEKVCAIANLTFINDSKATNAASTKPALQTFKNIIWILGGISKDGGIEEMHLYFNRIRFAYIFGQAADSFAKVFKRYNVSYMHTHTLQEAMSDIACRFLNDGKMDYIVLLSPACSSYDQWQNFEHRGSAFAALATDICNNIACISQPLT